MGSICIETYKFLPYLPEQIAKMTYPCVIIEVSAKVDRREQALEWTE